LLDVNGRFWTWNGLGELAGIDFPYLAWRQAMDMSVQPARAKPGVAWMHASRDIMAAFGELTAGSLTLGKYLKSLGQPLTFANFAVDDPMPALVELPVAAWNRFAYKVTEAPKRTLAQTIARKLGIAPRRVAK